MTRGEGEEALEMRSETKRETGSLYATATTTTNQPKHDNAA